MDIPPLETLSAPGYSSGVLFGVIGDDTTSWPEWAAAMQRMTGLEHVEIALEDVAIGESKLQELRGLFGGHRLLLRAPVWQLSMVSHHEEVRSATAEVYRRTLELARALSAQVVTVCGGTRPRILDETVALEQIGAMYRDLRHSAGAMVLSLKNMRAADEVLAGYPGSLAELSRCLESVPELLVTLDLGYSILDGEDWWGFMRNHKARVASIHANAADLPPASRVTDLFTLGRLLRVVSYTGHVSLGAATPEDLLKWWRRWRRAQAEAAEDTTASLRAQQAPREPDTEE